MIRLIALFSAALLFGCTAQSKTVFIANFRNACAYPVDITAHDYSNGKAAFAQPIHLKPGDHSEVLSYISPVDDIETSFPSTYRLDIAARGNIRSLNKPELIQQLKQSDYLPKGNAIHTWTISDSMLCP